MQTTTEIITRILDNGEHKEPLTARWRDQKTIVNLKDGAIMRFDHKTGHLCEIIWAKYGAPHRTDGPAILHYFSDTGGLKAQIWIQNGQIHRDDGPAVTYFNKRTSKPMLEIWYQNGKPHNDDGPAFLRYFAKSGKIRTVAHMQNGRLSRFDGPALTRYGGTGVATLELWALDEREHPEIEFGYVQRSGDDGKIVDRKSWSGVERERFRVDLEDATHFDIWVG